MHFLAPAWLLSLLLVAAVLVAYVLLQRRRRKFVVRFSNAALLASVAPRRPGWRRHLTFGLLLAALSVLAIGAAGPTAAVRIPRDRATVMLAIDVSESMIATDVLPSRLEASKAAAKAFVDLLPPRINVGLVAFARSASVLVSPTIDRDMLKSAIDTLQPNGGTAIGEAVFASLDSIAVFSKNTTAKGDQPAPARVVLMSDGANNSGRTVDSAAAAAKSASVPVSTVAFGTDSGTISIDGDQILVPADKTTLKALADDTGGSFHTAASAEELRSVYANIGSQIGYTTTHRSISGRYLDVGLLLALAAAAASLLWAGRLL
jgi:Ca-activated chloride channel homolog